MNAETSRALKQDITEVLIAYATGIDRRDWALLGECFAPNCDVNYEGAGRWTRADEIVEFMTAAHEGMGHTLHRLSNITITVDGSNAQARTYVDAVLMAPDRATGINAVGFYDDELSLIDERWRIARRRYSMARLRTFGPEGILAL